MEKTRTLLVLDRSMLETDVLHTRFFLLVCCHLLSSPSRNPPTNFFSVHHMNCTRKLQPASVGTVCPSKGLVVVVADEMRTEQWIALVAAFTVTVKEVFIQAASIGASFA